MPLSAGTASHDVPERAGKQFVETLVDGPYTG